MSYQERVNKFKLEKENSIQYFENEINLTNNEKDLEVYKKYLEAAKYALDNAEAAYSSGLILDVGQEVYYPTYPNKENTINRLAEITGVDASLIPINFDNLPREVLREELIKLAEIPVQVPSVSETILSFAEIYNSDLPSEDKNNELSKIEALTGLNRELAQYANKPLPNKEILPIVNREGVMLNAPLSDSFSIFYERGLSKENISKSI